MLVVRFAGAWYTPAVSRSLAIAALGTVLVGALLPGLAQAGEAVLLPDFTPGTVSEFGLASLMQQTTAEALTRAGHVVLRTEAVRGIVGENALDACFDEDTCPRTALGKLPARYAIVVRVRRDGQKVFADIRLHEQTGIRPLEEITVEVVPGEEDEIGRKAADLVDEMAKVMGPADARDLLAAAKIIAAFEEGSAEPDTPDPIPDPVEPDPPADPDPPAIVTGPKPPPPDPQPDPDPRPTPIEDLDLTTAEGLAQALDGTNYAKRHLVGVRDNFVESGLDVRAWAARRTPHAGRTIIEVRGGVGIGDVDRLAQVRTTVAGGEQTQWFREGPTSATRVRGGLFVGYAPTAWIDVGALMGLQYGERELDSGWSDDAGGGETSLDSVEAVQFYLQPRLRFYPVRMGPVKPYVAAGADLRFFDQWRIKPVDGVEYGEPPGGMVPGALVAGGLLIDPSPIVGFFFEASYAPNFGPRSQAAQLPGVDVPAGAPIIVEGDGRVIGLVGGLQFRL